MSDVDLGSESQFNYRANTPKLSNDHETRFILLGTLNLFVPKP